MMERNYFHWFEADGRQAWCLSINDIHEKISQFLLVESSAVRARKYSAIFEILTIFVIKRHWFTSVVLTNVFSLWKYWQSEVNKLFCTWRKCMTKLCIILSCILLISNSMVSRAIWKNKHLCVFQRPQIALVLRICAILIVFEKLTCACFFQIFVLETMLLPILINLWK